jgi:superfamily II DNA or RNA helicase
MRLIIDSQLTLLNIPTDIKSWFIEQLTFSNPKFEEAVKQGRYLRNIEPEIKLYKSLPGGIVVPRGYLQIVEDSMVGQGLGLSIKDNRVLNPPISLKSNIILRPYQAQAKFDLFSHPNGMLVAPAASGKTIMGLDVFASVRQNMLWITHTNRLAEQVIERITQVFDIPKEEIGLIGGGKFKIGERITIGMIPTLVRRTEELMELGRTFGLVIVDECLVEGSKILMIDGSIKDIEEVNDSDITSFGEVSHKFQRLTDRTIKLRGSWGVIEGTPAHRLPYIPRDQLVIDKHTNCYRKLSENDIVFGIINNIEPKDFLLVQESFCHTYKYNFGRRKSRLAALISCDGHIENHYRCIQIGITKDKKWFLDEIMSDTSYVENPDIRTSDCKRGDLIIRAYSIEVIKDMLEFIPAGKKSRLIKVPQIIMESSLGDIKEFLQVVFDTEGSVTDQITLTMASHEFIYGIQFLLRKFGIIGRIVPIKYKNMLRVAMSGYDAFLFWKKIGFSMVRKQEALTILMKETKKFRRTVEYNSIVYRCVEVLEKEIINKPNIVYDFTTSEHLFLANGVLSSNCHHVPASTFLKVLSHFASYYLYGLTATPYRRDKLEDLMFATIGLANAVVERKEVKKRGAIITPEVIKRTITATKWRDNDFHPHNDYHYVLKELILPNVQRLETITNDVVREANEGNYCIVINTRKIYAEELLVRISKHIGDKAVIATGDYTKKQNEAQVQKVNSGEANVLITTFELLGEGFDVPKLNRGFLALPFRERARVEQSVGRIQRTCEGKTDAIMYDYVDENVGILKNQFIHRAMAYRLLGMKIHEVSDV